MLTSCPTALGRIHLLSTEYCTLLVPPGIEKLLSVAGGHYQ